MFSGVPLYPVETMRRSRTTTAPTRFPRQLARRRTAMAIPMKYSSGLGRSSMRHRSSFRTTSLRPDQISLTAHTLTST
jgi:hypothetical protein